MAFIYTTFYVGGVLCIWFSSQVSCKEGGPCAPDGGASCYLKYTQEKLHAALRPDLNVTQLCSSMPLSSLCQDDCSMSDSEQKRREEAYAAQRTIFCTDRNLRAYAGAATCFDQKPDFKDCIRQLSGEAKDTTTNNGYDCIVGVKRLMCLDQHTPKCSKFDTNIVWETYVNSQVLAGCHDFVAPMPQPSASEMDSPYSNFTDKSQHSGVATGSASELVTSGPTKTISLLVFGALTLHRKFTNSG